MVWIGERLITKFLFPQVEVIEEYLEKNKEEFSKWLVHNEQGRIDIKILPYLKDIDKGFFIEAGALDGLFMSNTKILEDLGWKGLLVEPQRKAFEKCLLNRKAISVWGGLVSSEYNQPLIRGDFFFDGEDGEGAWASPQRGAYSGREGFHIWKEVPAYTLKFILKELDVKKVDFFSLDVEGYEMEVLKGIDFNEVDFRNILIESNPEYTLEELQNFMTDKGFKQGINFSNFNEENSPKRIVEHQDYLFTK